MYHNHTHCRACHYGKKETAPGIKSAESSKSLIPVFDLGLQPLANDFTADGEERSGYAPLKVMLCPKCTLAQLSVVVQPDILYRHYSYVTSASETMAKHFRALLALITEIGVGHSLLEIGSNDGRMLAFFREQGFTVHGIDPAENLASVANSIGIPTTVGLFGAASATEATRCGVFDAVFARHVFCHVDDWSDFISCLTIVTHRNSLVFIEVPYAGDMIAKGEFDTIYHEHTSYMTIRAMDALVRRTGVFKLARVDHFPIHGGALVLTLARSDGDRAVGTSVSQWLDGESLGEPEWIDFRQRAQANVSNLTKFVVEKRAEKKTVVGFGASAKSTVWINACGFTRQDISFITDTTLLKQWKTSPGSDIPIYDEGAILRELPDYAICFAWNFRSEIIAKNELARSKGVKFVFPIPTLEIV